MQFERLQAVTQKFVAEFPPEIEEQLQDVDFLVAENPDDATRELNRLMVDPLDEAIPLDTKGVFVGEPTEVEDSDESEDEEKVVDAEGWVVLVASNISDEEEAAMVLLHETAHALGYDEDEVAQLGLSAFQRKEGADAVPTANS